MKNRLLMLCAIILFSAISARAQFTFYPNDRPGWENAVLSYQEEFFDDAIFNPGVSVVSDLGHVVTGVWWDRLLCPAKVDPDTGFVGPSETIWHFDAPIYAFGAIWDPGVPGGPGAGIQVVIEGSWVTVGEISNTIVDEFWGFVSTIPFNYVRLTHGSHCNGAWSETYELDNMVYSASIGLDIKPQSCPNPFNIDSKGVLPVAILGSASFDVTTIDPASILLKGVPPLRWSFEDVSSPVADRLNACDCTSEGPDGFLDLTLKFKTQAIVAAMGGRKAILELPAEPYRLALTGLLLEAFGGKIIAGVDCVLIRHSNSKKR